MYGNDIRYFANLLCPFKRYYISNTTLSFTDPFSGVTECEFSWILNNIMLVEEAVENLVPVLPRTFELAKFASLFRYADTENLQSQHY